VSRLVICFDNFFNELVLFFYGLEVRLIAEASAMAVIEILEMVESAVGDDGVAGMNRRLSRGSAVEVAIGTMKAQDDHAFIRETERDCGDASRGNEHARDNKK
jgi:hypothetical protein